MTRLITLPLHSLHDQTGRGAMMERRLRDDGEVLLIKQNEPSGEKMIQLSLRESEHTGRR